MSANSHYILVQIFILIRLLLLEFHIAVLLKFIHFLVIPKLLLLFVVSIIWDFLNRRPLGIFFRLCVINSFINLKFLGLVIILFRRDRLNIAIDLKLVSWILWEPGFISSVKLIRNQSSAVTSLIFGLGNMWEEDSGHCLIAGLTDCMSAFPFIDLNDLRVAADVGHTLGTLMDACLAAFV